MKILQQHYEQELANIEKEILEISSKLTPFHNLELYKNNLRNLQTNIEILKRHILRGKEKKFQRDSLAFTLGRAYKWCKVEKETKENTPDPNRPHLEDPILTPDDEANQTVHLPSTISPPPPHKALWRTLPIFQHILWMRI